FRYDECSIFYKLLSGKARNKTGDKPYYKKDEHADTDDREPTIPCLCVRRQILWHGKNADANHHRRDRDHNFPLRNGFITMCKFFHTLCPSLISRFFILCLHIFRSPVDQRDGNAQYEIVKVLEKHRSKRAWISYANTCQIDHMNVDHYIAKNNTINTKQGRGKHHDVYENAKCNGKTIRRD